MHQRVQYPDTIEPLVQFIEQTPPAEIIDRTLEKLRAGTEPKTMLTASALAVVRSADLPPGHHGGPLHPLAGLHAITNLVNRLEGEDRFMPILQHVALSNKHINDPVTSPYSLLEFAPLDPSGAQVTRTEARVHARSGRVAGAMRVGGGRVGRGISGCGGAAPGEIRRGERVRERDGGGRGAAVVADAAGACGGDGVAGAGTREGRGGG